MQDPLADKILAGEIPDGSKVKITGGTDKLLFLPRVAGGRGQGQGRLNGRPEDGQSEGARSECRALLQNMLTGGDSAWPVGDMDYADGMPV